MSKFNKMKIMPNLNSTVALVTAFITTSKLQEHTVKTPKQGTPKLQEHTVKTKKQGTPKQLQKQSPI